MTSRIKEILDKKNREFIDKHMPAKGVVIDEDAQSDIEKFKEQYEAQIVADSDTSRNIEDDGFHPSSLGIKHGKCPRRAVYLLQGVPKGGSFPPRVLTVFATGHATHERIQTIMEHMDINMVSEVVIDSNDPPIKGHADGTFEFNGRKILLEVKSCNENVFTNRLKWKKPKDEHFEQANIYAHILDYDYIWFIYENKNNQEMAIFEVKANRKKSQKQIDAWAAQYLIYQEGELPKRPYTPDSPICASCDLKPHCFSDPTVGVDIKPYEKRVKDAKAEAGTEG